MQVLLASVQVLLASVQVLFWVLCASVLLGYFVHPYPLPLWSLGVYISVYFHPLLSPCFFFFCEFAGETSLMAMMIFSYCPSEFLNTLVVPKVEIVRLIGPTLRPIYVYPRPAFGPLELLPLGPTHPIYSPILQVSHNTH